MKLKAILTLAASALIAAMALSSCQKQNVASDAGTKNISIRLNFGSTATKAVDLEAPWDSNNYTTVNSIQIYFTDAADNIKYAWEGTAAGTGDAATIWNYLTDKSSYHSGVRFIGLNDVAHVYVLANGPHLQGVNYVGAQAANSSVKIDALNTELTLEKYVTGNQTQDYVVYAGAVQSLSMSTSGATGASGEIDLSTQGDEVAPEYTANVTIRPVMSRIEVEKVTVQSAGSVYFDANFDVVAANDANAAYKADYTGFQPDFVGLYMSNCYTNAHLFPYQTTLTTEWTLFETPTFGTQQAAPIQGGVWFNTALGTNVPEYLSIADYTSPDYAVFSSYTATPSTNNTTILFDGVTNQASGSPLGVPAFEFYVPYDITSTVQTAANQEALATAEFPILHFQFKKGQDINLTVNSGSVAIGFNTSVNSGTAEYNSISNRLTWPNVANSENGIAFANVTAFYEDESFNTLVTPRPGYIYRVKDVLVGPANINANTTSASSYSVYVNVSVVPFVELPVYPSFE